MRILRGAVRTGRICYLKSTKRSWGKRADVPCRGMRETEGRYMAERRRNKIGPMSEPAPRRHDGLSRPQTVPYAAVDRDEEEEEAS